MGSCAPVTPHPNRAEMVNQYSIYGTMISQALYGSPIIYGQQWLTLVHNG